MTHHPGEPNRLRIVTDEQHERTFGSRRFISLTRNPAHLYVGDQFNNMRDMVERRRNWQAAVTHCPRGHVYSGGNLWIDKSGRRHCRECGRIACREWWARSGREYAERKRQQVTAA